MDEILKNCKACDGGCMLILPPTRQKKRTDSLQDDATESSVEAPDRIPILKRRFFLHRTYGELDSLLLYDVLVQYFLLAGHMFGLSPSLTRVSKPYSPRGQRIIPSFSHID